VVYDGADFDYCKIGLTPEDTKLTVITYHHPSYILHDLEAAAVS
jgi:hypothetical protein